MKQLFSAILFLAAILSCSAEAFYPRPRRPERLEKPEHSSSYLKDLQEFYAAHGRGRFGKRQMHISDESVVFREAPFLDRHINDVLFGYL